MIAFFSLEVFSMLEVSTLSNEGHNSFTMSLSRGKGKEHKKLPNHDFSHI